MTAHVLLSLGFSLAGLAVGYWLGRAGRLRRGPWKVEPMPRLEEQPPHRGPRLLGIALVVLALLSVAVMAISVGQQRALVEREAVVAACQNEYNRQFAAALAQRNDAAAREREGQRRLLEASFRPREERDPDEVAAAYQQYLAVLAEADAQRDANPLPVQEC